MPTRPPADSAVAEKEGCALACLHSYAATKACVEVLHQRPLSITQQASLQSRHYRLPQQAAGARTLLGRDTDAGGGFCISNVNGTAVHIYTRMFVCVCFCFKHAQKCAFSKARAA